MRLTIPPYIPESRLDGCDIIDIKYELEFHIDISGKSQLSVTIPIVVGTANGSEQRNEGGRDADPTIHNWSSRDNLDVSTLKAAVRNGGLDHNSNTGGAEDGDFDGMAISPSQVDMDEIADATLRFRRPLDAGETRRNPLLDMEGGFEDYPIADSPPPASPVTPVSPMWPAPAEKGPAPLPPAADYSPPPSPPSDDRPGQRRSTEYGRADSFGPRIPAAPVPPPPPPLRL